MDYVLFIFELMFHKMKEKVIYSKNCFTFLESKEQGMETKQGNFPSQGKYFLFIQIIHDFHVRFFFWRNSKT